MPLCLSDRANLVENRMMSEFIPFRGSEGSRGYHLAPYCFYFFSVILKNFLIFITVFHRKIIFSAMSSHFSSVQLLSRVWLFATPWTAACQASLSITNSQSLLKFMSVELEMPSNNLILCHPLLLLPSIFPSIGSCPVSQFFASGGQIIGVTASASVLPMNIQDWSPLGWTGWISL